jgi:hypothetical protein
VADAPEMHRLKIIEIEPAVLAMDSLFQPVNGAVLTRPTVRVVVDDARSALQLDRDRYDIIVSEPSNPWVAGIATLYTPEFFRIAQSRLSTNGVFCQWIQLYQLPLPVVAGIVRSIRTVFPHVHMWFGGTADLLVLASAEPLRYDRSWLMRLIGPGAPLERLAHEWLSIDSLDEYFGRLLLGDSGVARLVRRAGFVHTDDRPRLEFVAARRFLDPTTDVYTVFDSLVQFGSGDSGIVPLARLSVLAARRSDAGLLPYLDAAREAQPGVDEWTARAAGVYLTLGDTATADSLLDVATARGARDALQTRSLLAAARNDPLAGLALREALAAGADTAQIRAALSLLAVRASRWREAAFQVHASLAAAQGTFRHPFPGEFLTQAMGQVALEAPPALADSVLSYAVAKRPGSARYREFAAAAALRAGKCEDAAATLIGLMDFAIRRDNAPALVRECWNGQRAMVESTATRAGGSGAVRRVQEKQPVKH